MLRRALWAAPVGLALAGSGLAKPKPHPSEPTPPPPPARHGSALIGAWLLVSAETFGEGGKASPAFGDRANGLLVYDHSGEMSLQIAGERPAVGSVEIYASLSPGDRMVFLDNYYAYFGVFDVDEAARTVVHRVRASLRPNENGISYVRQFLIDGDRLTLASQPETHAGIVAASRMIFVRAQAPP